MKRQLIFIVCLSLSIVAFSQKKHELKRSWIRTISVDLSERHIKDDTTYARYLFSGPALYISFTPAWNNFKVNWSRSGEKLQIGAETYIIKELTDTTLVIESSGFRHLEFLEENYLAADSQYLQLIGNHNNKPLYLANNIITPRYSTSASLTDIVNSQLGDYNLKEAITFRASFIVNENGGIEDFKVINSIASGFDAEVKSRILKTSKKWTPAYFDGKPIQSLMYYEIKYLGSIRPGRVGG